MSYESMTEQEAALAIDSRRYGPPSGQMRRGLVSFACVAVSVVVAVFNLAASPAYLCPVLGLSRVNRNYKYRSADPADSPRV